MVELESHYRTALSEMTLAGVEDDLAELFPLLAPARHLPAPSERTELVLGRYRTRRALVRSHGITLGRARLAFKADECTRCGLCMTGCPYELDLLELPDLRPPPGREPGHLPQWLAGGPAR